MSKTTKTRPLHVRMADRTDHKVGRVEIHDHRKSSCTLPPPGQYGDGPCRYGFAYRGVNVCGCPLCTAQEERRAERRRDRHEVKTSLHQIAVGALEAA